MRPDYNLDILIERHQESQQPLYRELTEFSSQHPGNVRLRNTEQLAGLASVSFDAPAAGINVPGRMLHVSSGQLNVAVPWELAGQKSVEMKATAGNSLGQVFTMAVADCSPAVYVAPDAGAGQAGAALDLNGVPISTLNLARASQQQTIHVWLNGLGAVSNPPRIGYVAQTQPPSTPVAEPAVSIAME